MKLELDGGKIIYEFGESEYLGKKFISFKKVTMPFKKGDKIKFQNLSIRLRLILQLKILKLDYIMIRMEKPLNQKLNQIKIPSSRAKRNGHSFMQG